MDDSELTRAGPGKDVTRLSDYRRRASATVDHWKVGFANFLEAGDGECASGSVAKEAYHGKAMKLKLCNAGSIAENIVKGL